MKNKALNICLISREFPPDTAFGGIATFSVDTALMLKNYGHTVTIFSQSLSSSSIQQYQGITVHKLKVPSLFESYKRLPTFILAFNSVVLNAVLKEHQKNPFDIIDVPDHLAEGLFCSIWKKLPVVTRIHTPYSLIVDLHLNNCKKNISYQIIKFLEREAIKNSNVIYAPCSDIVRRTQKLLSCEEVPVKVFGYPLDLNLFSPDDGLQKSQNVMQVLFLGRFEQRKGIETIVKAFPLALSYCPNLKLTLIGNDTYNIKGILSGRQFMELEFTKANCREKVVFLDPVSLEKLPNIFREHDIVWIPSLYDNYPLVCLEAMACAKAVIASDAGGLPEIIHHERTGLIFPAGDFTRLAECTVKLYSNSQLRKFIGHNARKEVEMTSSYDTIYQKTLELYDIAIKNNKHKRNQNE